VGVVDISTKVVADAAGAALASCGIPAGADVIEPVLRSLLQVQDEQAQAIARAFRSSGMNMASSTGPRASCAARATRASSKAPSRSR
jgi:hypothetical protein